MPVHPAKSEKLGQTANARGMDETSEKKTHVPLRFFIAANGVFPGRA